MQIAQECYIENEDNQSSSNRKFEGLEAFAKSIESSMLIKKFIQSFIMQEDMYVTYVGMYLIV